MSRIVKNPNSYYLTTIKPIGVDAYRDKVEAKKIQRIELKLNSFMTTLAPIKLKGEIKQKFYNKIKQQGYTETELVNEIFERYFSENRY